MNPLNRLRTRLLAEMLKFADFHDFSTFHDNRSIAPSAHFPILRGVHETAPQTEQWSRLWIHWARTLEGTFGKCKQGGPCSAALYKETGRQRKPPPELAADGPKTTLTRTKTRGVFECSKEILDSLRSTLRHQPEIGVYLGRQWRGLAFGQVQRCDVGDHGGVIRAEAGLGEKQL